MERNDQSAAELIELGTASTDTQGAVFGEIEWSGLLPRNGIISE